MTTHVQQVVCTIGVCWLAANLLWAQHPEYYEYTVKDGLRTERFILDITQGPSGDMWLCSFQGIDRFDGVNASTYGSQGELPDHYVTRAFPWRNKMFFLGHYGGLFYHDGKKFITFPTPDTAKWLMHGSKGYNIRILSDNHALFGIKKNGCIRLDSSGQVDILVAPTADLHGGGVLFPGRDLEPIGFTIDDKEFCSSSNTIWLYDSCGSPLTHIVLDTLPTSTREHLNVTSLRGGEIAICWGRHLLRMKGDTVYQHVILEQNSNQLLLDREGSLWVGQYKNGVNYFPGGDLYSKHRAHYFHDKNIMTVQLDREGGIWMSGLENNAIYNIPSTQHRVWEEAPDSTPLPPLLSIQVHKDRIYLGAADGKLLIMDSTGLEVRDLSEGVTGIRDYAIRRLHWDSSTSVLVCAMENRLIHVTENGDTRITELKHEYFDGITQLVKSPRGDYTWIVNRPYVFRLTKGNIDFVLDDPPSVVYSFAEDERGRFWFGTQKGLWKYENGLYTSYTEKHAFFDGRIVTLATAGELLLIHNFNMGIGIARNDTILEVYPHLAAKHIQTEADTFWVLDGKRLNKFYPDCSGSIVDQAKALTYTMFTDVRDFNINGDQFHFASNKGVMTFSRSFINSRNEASEARITAVEVNHRDTTGHPHYGLPFDRNNLGISYRISTYKSPTSARYRYRMIGLDDTWHLTSHTSVQYAELPPGEYRFEVVAENYDLQWSLEPATVTFSIHPPFWGTWAFRLLLIVVVVAGTFSIVRWQWVRGRKKLKTEQELMQLESKALRAQMNPHFVFNVLSAIQSYVSEGNTSASEIYLGKFAGLIRRILENSRSSFIPIHEELRTIRYYLDLEQMRFQNGFDYTIEVDPELDMRATQIPPMIIQPYLENAIVHGLHSRTGKGKIELRLKRMENLLHCEITDNGIGYQGAGQHVSSQNGHKPMGLLITRERLALLQHQAADQLSVTLEDLSKETSGTSGTRVTITLPITTKPTEHENTTHRRRRTLTHPFAKPG